MSQTTKLAQAHAALADALAELETQEYFIKAPWRITIKMVRVFGAGEWYNTYIRLRKPDMIEYELDMGWNRAYIDETDSGKIRADAAQAVADVKAFIAH